MSGVEPGTDAAREVLEACQLQFEEWAHEFGMTLDTDFFSSAANKYVEPDTRLAFDIWMASRAADSLSRRVAELEGALRELVDAEEAKYPFSEEGAAAQAAWSERRYRAREAARAALKGQG